MYTVYILESVKNGRHYIGMTSDMAQRLKQHNTGANRFTRNKGPWKLIYTEDYLEKFDAWKREKQIKRYKGGVAFRKLIGEIA